MKADKYYIVSHGRGPRFVITSHYALALFGRDEVGGTTPGAHLEKVGSWDDAVAALRQRALAWRDSAATRHAHGTPEGGVAVAARTPASAATTFGGEADSDDESVAASEAKSSHFGGPKDGSSPTNAAISEQSTQIADTLNEQLGAMTGLGASMAQIAASVATLQQGRTPATKGSTVGFSVQPSKQRKDDMSACNERERVAKAKTGIAFENTRAQVIVALRLSTGDGRDIDLAFGGTALEAYVLMLGLTAEPASRSTALANAGVNMTAVTAAYLTELRVSHSASGPEGFGCAETHFEADEATLAIRRENLTERLLIGGRLKVGRARGPPKSMLPERLRKNRDALSELIGSYIGKRAGDSLVELVQEEYGKAEKPGYDLHKADEVFCEVIRKWVAAGAKLLKDADVGVYMDTVDTGQLIAAHLASKPEEKVKTPCAENYPTVLGDRATDDEAMWEAHKLRQVEREHTLRQAESGSTPARAGECDDAPETPAISDAAVPSGGGGAGGGGGDSLASRGGTPAGGVSKSATKKVQASARRTAEEAKRTAAAVTSALAEQEARHGQLTGSPGGVPVVGGGRFVVPATTKAAASGKDPRGDKNLLFCRKCSSWPCKLGKQGKPYNGAIHVCPGTLDFHHDEYHDNTQISACTLANTCNIGGCLALPMTKTREKQQTAHDLLMTDGATRSYKEWKT